MSDSEQHSSQTPPAPALAEQDAHLAYRIIQSLLEHTRVTSDLVALMAQVLDRDTTEALTNTPYWSAYLDSRRAMERTRADIERFTEILTRLSTENEAPAADE